jgi:hypothetical protein
MLTWLNNTNEEPRKRTLSSTTRSMSLPFSFSFAFRGLQRTATCQTKRLFSAKIGDGSSGHHIELELVQASSVHKSHDEEIQSRRRRSKLRCFLFEGPSFIEERIGGRLSWSVAPKKEKWN